MLDQLKKLNDDRSKNRLAVEQGFLDGVKALKSTHLNSSAALKPKVAKIKTLESQLEAAKKDFESVAGSDAVFIELQNAIDETKLGIEEMGQPDA